MKEKVYLPLNYFQTPKCKSMIYDSGHPFTSKNSGLPLLERFKKLGKSIDHMV